MTGASKIYCDFFSGKFMNADLVPADPKTVPIEKIQEAHDMYLHWRKKFDGFIKEIEDMKRSRVAQ